MYWPIFALFLGALSIGTTEFVVSGILPSVAADMGVSISAAALLVTGYALGVAIGGPALTLATTRLSRKQLALWVLALFIAGHVVCALAPNYAILMVGRIAAAIGHGCYFGVAVVLAAQLAPKERVGTALSVLFSGVTIANIIGVPLGTAIGNAFGWRASFILVLAIAVVGFLGVALLVPGDRRREASASGLGRQFTALMNWTVGSSYLLIILMMLSFWSFNTFIAPFYTEVVGLPVAWLPLALLAGGSVATLGIFAGGRLADRRPNQTLQWSFPALALTCLATALLAPLSMPLGILTAVTLALPVTVVATVVQNRVIQGASAAPDLASTLISSVFNVGVAAGSWLGAAALSGGTGYAQLPYIGVGGAIIASVVAYFAARADRRRVATE